MRKLMSVDQIVETLGGTKTVSELLGVTAQTVSGWRLKTIASRHYLVMMAELNKIGCTASPALWGIKVAA